MIAPTTEAELSDFLSEASEPVRIVGGGTRQNLGNSVKAKKKLTTAETVFFQDLLNIL